MSKPNERETMIMSLSMVLGIPIKLIFRLRSLIASANAEVAAENMAAFAEVAKKVQMDTVELLMAAGKDIQEDTAKAVKKATDEMTAAAKKATAK